MQMWAGVSPVSVQTREGHLSVHGPKPACPVAWGNERRRWFVGLRKQVCQLPEDLRRRALGLFLESKDVQEELQPCTNVM